MPTTDPSPRTRPSNPLPGDAIESIPGIGLVRARCLRKAGWPDVGALRSATVEQIAAVPGVSPLKAREIVEYLRANPPRREPEAPAAAEQPASPASRVTDAAASLLAPDSNISLRPRLVGQLRRWLDASARIAASVDASGKLGRRLARATDRVEAIVAGTAPGRKRQRRLARRLRGLRKRLLR